jgi:hypothetical protein
MASMEILPLAIDVSIHFMKKLKSNQHLRPLKKPKCINEQAGQSHTLITNCGIAGRAPCWLLACLVMILLTAPPLINTLQ